MLSGMATAETAVAPKATARGAIALIPFMVVVKAVLELNNVYLLIYRESLFVERRSEVEPSRE